MPLIMPIHVERLKPDRGLLEGELEAPGSDADVLAAVGVPSTALDGEFVVMKVAGHN